MKYQIGDIVQVRLNTGYSIAGTAATVLKYDSVRAEYSIQPLLGTMIYTMTEAELEPFVWPTASVHITLPIGANQPLFSDIQEPYSPPTQALLKCECGVDSVGAGMHSSWCPKANIT